MIDEKFRLIMRRLDDEDCLKQRDQMSGFRRRAKIFAHDAGEPYRSHMRDTLQQWPDYIEWMLKDGRFDDIVPVMRDLAVELTALMEGESEQRKADTRRSPRVV